MVHCLTSIICTLALYDEISPHRCNFDGKWLHSNVHCTSACHLAYSTACPFKSPVLLPCPSEETAEDKQSLCCNPAEINNIVIVTLELPLPSFRLVLSQGEPSGGKPQ
ncbi:hypothetical protein F2P81_013521 [Scophthalmus maximus]|uniref:Uncharacterized protein n=1 Tax=Scophthalmus maximus TaxID=52904 RepID=A0A6A4SLL7_SCOMX|nr:hypothetical protein F2P81_013521 [Scophthalmus maximus]